MLSTTVSPSMAMTHSRACKWRQWAGTGRRTRTESGWMLNKHRALAIQSLGWFQPIVSLLASIAAWMQQSEAIQRVSSFFSCGGERRRELRT